MAEDNKANSGLDGLSEKAYEIARRRKAAAQELVTMLEDEYETWFESSAASLLRACAWLAGTSLFRSFGFDRKLEPGSPVLSDKSNTEGMKMLKVFMFLIDQDGIKLKPDDFAVSIPADKRSTKSILQVQEHFQDRYNDIMRRHDFDYVEGAKTGAVACARLVKLHCLNRSDLEPSLAATIVTMGFVEGAKTAPANLGGPSNGTTA
jgi:hypothetical protein